MFVFVLFGYNIHEFMKSLIIVEVYSVRLVSALSNQVTPPECIKDSIN